MVDCYSAVVVVRRRPRSSQTTLSVPLLRSATTARPSSTLDLLVHYEQQTSSALGLNTMTSPETFQRKMGT